MASDVALFDKAKELSAGRVERALLIFGPVGDERSTFIVEDREHDLPITRQVEALNVSRSSVYYTPTQ